MRFLLDETKIKEYIESFNYKVLSSGFSKAKDRVLVMCPNGHQYETTYDNFKGSKNRKGARCRICANKEAGERKRLSEEHALDIIHSLNYTLLSKYKDTKTKNKILCPEGHIFYMSLELLKRGHKCPKCMRLVIKDKLKLDYSYVKDQIEENNYILLSKTYVNCEEKLHLVCPEGHGYYASFSVFSKGHRCALCYFESISGSNSDFWKGGIASENSQIRNSTEYNQWRKLIFERDEYTCQICGQIGVKINAHHIENFSDNKDLRFDINNGITMCGDCHDLKSKTSFHVLYWTYNNTREQLDEYKQRYKFGEFKEM